MTGLLAALAVVGTLVGLASIWRLRRAAVALSAMRSSEERYRALFQFTTDGVICHQADGRVIAANPAAEAILGMSAAAMRALEPWRVWQQMCDSGGRPYATAEMPCVIALKTGQHVKDTIVGTAHWATGAAVWLQLESIPLGSAGESRSSQVIAVFMDVTEQRRGEERLRVIVDSSPNALLMIDRQGVIALANSASQRTFGYEREELVGHSVDLLLPDSLQSGHDAHRQRYLAAPTTRPIGEMAELQARRKDGSLIPVDVGLSPITTADGDFTLATVVDISERKETERTMARLVHFDALTGLPNRRLLLERLQHALAVSARRQRYGALLFLDVDNFKTINDTSGHDVGDLMLQQVAARQQAILRESDSIARVGGDEFVVLLEELDDRIDGAAAYAKEVADKLQVALSAPYVIRGREYPGSVSIGVALWGGDMKGDVNDLLRHSDMAMYDAKKAGRNAVRFFDPVMQEVLEKRTHLESDLHRAIVDRQLLLHLQRRVRADGRVRGAEVLLRWQHPDRGLVAPMQFIPLAEETGLIVPIGQWVLETTCRQLAVWARRPATRGLMLSVNISAVEFRQQNFVDHVRRILAETGADPALLELEITESMLLDDVEVFIAKMKALRETGLSFALDDFGTGYSSLAYLKRLPLNMLKIDKSFVSDIDVDKNDETIVQTIISMGQTLGLDVIAEGVETEAQRRILVRHGCDNFQGYLFGRPVAADCFERDLEQPLLGNG